MVKPVPVRVAELMVTGAVPVDVKVTDWVAGAFTSTSPNATLVALIPSVGVPALLRVFAGAPQPDRAREQDTITSKPMHQRLSLNI